MATELTVKCASCGFGLSGVIRNGGIWMDNCFQCKKKYIRKGYEKGYAHREIVEENKQEEEANAKTP